MDNPELELLEKHAIQLSEHFETVQIFATRHDPDEGTFNIAFGNGNWFARFGQISEWITKCHERTKEDVRKNDEP